ncbi:hypothetical protein PCASD_23414 [Puccinia coronata f. sp. avenae]|uniref:Uncharacterized protein n=1 Tax=Puccinia coronata f. sp. avenae TaxID=200324 RepID=A0A2N5TPX3_9BASI|nr:hypothetical protein PCASD_23414 [Puccinia coronata f. sp. avenae]
MSLFLNQHSEGTPHPHRVPSATPRTNRRRLSSPSEEEPNPQRQCSQDSDSDHEEDPFSILQQAKDNHRHSLPENDQDIDPDLAPAGQSTSRPLARFMEMIGVDADEHINTAPMELQTLFRKLLIRPPPAHARSDRRQRRSLPSPPPRKKPLRRRPPPPKDDGQHAKLAALSASGGGVDTFGNEGTMRVPVGSPFHPSNRLAAQKTGTQAGGSSGSNPFMMNSSTSAQHQQQQQPGNPFFTI